MGRPREVNLPSLFTIQRLDAFQMIGEISSVTIYSAPCASATSVNASIA